MDYPFDMTCLDQLCAREPRAITRWFKTFADVPYTVFYRVGRDEHMAADVVQETFMDALARIDQYDPQG